MTDYIKWCLNQFKMNIVLALKIEIFFLFFYTYVIFPVCNMFLERIGKSQGYDYFIDDNILNALKNAWFMIGAFAVFIILGIFFLFEIVLLLNVLNKKEDAGFKHILKKCALDLKRVIRPSGFFFVSISFIWGIFMHVTLFQKTAQDLGVFDFFNNIVFDNNGLVKLAPALLFVLLYLAISWLFVHVIIVVEGKSIKESFLHSSQMMRKNYVQILIRLFVLNIIILLAFCLIYLLLMFAVIIVIKSIETTSLQYAVSLTVMDTVNRLIIFSYSVAFILINLVVLSSQRNECLSGKANEASRDNVRSKQKRHHVLMAFFLILLVLFILFNDNFLKNFRIQTGYDPEGSKPEIVAHRGNSAYAPENTLAALQSAIEVRADRAEIDIQMTKDGVLVLMHDRSLHRTCNVTGAVSQYTYQELLAFDAGAWFSDDFAGEKIPTLEAALVTCKGELSLMLEIKDYYGKEKEMAEKVVALIREASMEQDVIVASFSWTILREVKELDPTIVTCLILRFAYGQFYEMDYVDMYSLEYRFAQASIIRALQESGKAINIWTVNESSRLVTMRNLGVDAVITDRPVRAREIFYDNVVPGFLNRMIHNMLLS